MKNKASPTKKKIGACGKINHLVHQIIKSYSSLAISELKNKYFTLLPGKYILTVYQTVRPFFFLKYIEYIPYTV